MFTQVGERFRALGEPARLRILDALRRSELTVGELVKNTGLSQANLSKHLQLLHRLGFVARSKQGLFVYYQLADGDVVRLCDVMCGRVAHPQRATYQRSSPEAKRRSPRLVQTRRARAMRYPNDEPESGPPRRSGGSRAGGAPRAPALDWPVRPRSVVSVANGQGFLVPRGRDAGAADHDRVANGLDAALAEAGRTNKHVLVDFSADWCPPCVAKHDVWPDPAVERALAGSYVPLLIDVDRNGAVADQYSVRGIPTVLVLDSRGRVVRQATFLSACRPQRWSSS